MDSQSIFSSSIMKNPKGLLFFRVGSIQQPAFHQNLMDLFQRCSVDNQHVNGAFLRPLQLFDQRQPAIEHLCLREPPVYPHGNIDVASSMSEGAMLEPKR